MALDLLIVEVEKSVHFVGRNAADDLRDCPMSDSTILLVDDDEVLRQVLRRVLTRDGYNVVEAGSVAQALERAHEQALSLGLVDLRLPDGDGVDLARQLEQQTVRFPLILMTAYPLRLRDHPELARGFAHVLTKPLNLDELRQAIESSLGVPSKRVEESQGSPVEREAPPPVSTAPSPSLTSTPAPDARRPASRRRLRWAVVAGIAMALIGLAIALPALGMPGIERLLRSPNARLAIPGSEARARLVSERDEEIELPPEVVDRLGVRSDPVQTAIAPRPLVLAGSLAFDPNRLGRVQARFGGEVISIGKPQGRTIRYGDRVTRGQVLAIVLSKDLGEKKNELVDSLVRLWYDEANLEGLEKLAERGQTAVVVVRTQRATVAMDRNAVSKAELTLRTWRVPDTEIAAVREEARQVFERKGKHDLEKETEWAKVEVLAPFDGTIVEQSISLGTIVDTTFDLFKVADLGKLGVLVHAYEEDLRELQALPRGFPWKVRAGADLRHQDLPSDGIQQIGLVVDPTQHTNPIMGLVDNTEGKLRVGQFVTATVNLPAPPNVVALPNSALEEDGAESIIFVQPDPAKPRYVLRRLSVVMRLRDMVYVRSEPQEAERKKGVRGVRPGEHVVTDGVLELKAALEDLQAKARARK
jgi:cobalt-zinc-cadmium efflux system membrane fusion protein